MFRNQKQFFHPNKKNIFGFLDPNKKKYFRFLDPNKKKKIFLNSSTQTKQNIFRFLNPNEAFSCLLLFFSWSIVSLFSAGQLFHQQKVGHGNETNCFGVRNNSLIQTKTYFSDSSTQTKQNIFRFLNPNEAFS